MTYMEVARLDKASAQGNLFGEGEDRMAPPERPATPDLDAIRRRLSNLLDLARSADTMPWSERDARMWRTVVPNMTVWLPADEGAEIRDAFALEMERLSPSRVGDPPTS
jgi:hypothetical protein